MGVGVETDGYVQMKLHVEQAIQTSLVIARARSGITSIKVTNFDSEDSRQEGGSGLKMTRVFGLEGKNGLSWKDFAFGRDAMV